MSATHFDEQKEELDARFQSQLEELKELKEHNLELTKKIEEDEKYVDQAD